MHAAKSAKVAAFRATVLPEVRRLIGGMSQRKIAAELNRRGLRTYAGRPWRCSMSAACWPPGAGLRHDPVITSCGNGQSRLASGPATADFLPNTPFVKSTQSKLQRIQALMPGPRTASNQTDVK